jgi:hypothetical protein
MGPPSTSVELMAMKPSLIPSEACKYSVDLLRGECRANQTSAPASKPFYYGVLAADTQRKESAAEIHQTVARLDEAQELPKPMDCSHSDVATAECGGAQTAPADTSSNVDRLLSTLDDVHLIPAPAYFAQLSPRAAAEPDTTSKPRRLWTSPQSFVTSASLATFTPPESKPPPFLGAIAPNVQPLVLQYETLSLSARGLAPTPHITIYLSAYYHICVLIHLILQRRIFVLILLYVSSYYYVFVFITHTIHRY